MYTPKPNEETRVEVVHELIRAHGLDLAQLDEARAELRTQVVAVWKGAVAGAPSLDEGALAELLQRLVRAGRRHEAKRRYDAFAGLVERELGLPPLASTAAALGGG